MRFSIALLLCFGAAACSTLTPPAPPPVYVVFFAGNGIALTDDARMIVDHAAAQAKSSGATMVQIAGQSTKSPGYNPAMAEPRIQAVEDALLADGITAAQLVRTSLTTGDAKVDASGAERVEIRLMDKPAI
jgi:hypothetical protein